MQHRETLNRIRTKFMYNLGIREIAEREVPSFIYKIDLPPLVVQLNREEKAQELKIEKTKITKSLKSFRSGSKKAQAMNSLGLRGSLKTPEHKDVTQTFSGAKQNNSGSTDKLSPDPSPALSKSKARRLAKNFDAEADFKKPADLISFKPYWSAVLYDKGCITCGRENLSVKYHGERHICLECRRKVKTFNGDHVVLFLDDEGDIVCKGIKVIRNTLGEIEKEIPYDADASKMIISVNNTVYKCHATISAPDELIVLLSDNQVDRRGLIANAEPRKSVLQRMNGDSLTQL